MNRTFVISVSALIVVILFLTGTYFYQRYSIIMLDPMKAVPADAAFILEAKKPAEAFKDFFMSQEKNLGADLWMTKIKSNFYGLDSLLKEEGDVKEIWQERPMVITAHIVNAKNFDFLFLTNLPRGWTENKLRNYISESHKLLNEFNKREFENVNIYESQLNDSVTFAFASFKSIAILSFTPLLVEQSIRQLQQGSSITQTKGFKKVAISSNKNIHLYLNYSLVRDFMTSLISENSNLFFNLSSFFARWTGFEMEDNPDYLTFKGTTTTFDTLDFISIFKNEFVPGGQSLHASSVAPQRTSFLFETGFHDFKSFYKRLHQNTAWCIGSNKEERSFHSEFERKFRINIDSSFISWTGHEMALIITEPAGSYLDNNVYAAIQTKNTNDAIMQLDRIRDAVKRKTGTAVPEETYLNHKISSIPLEGLIPLIYGKPFSRITNCYYSTINDFVLFANRSSALKALIAETEEGKLLSKDTSYVAVVNTLSPAANVQIYFSPQRCINLFSPEPITSFFSPIYKSSGVVAQWNYKGASIQTTMTFNFRKKNLPVPVLLWTTQLDTVISCAPVMLADQDQKTCFFVQDAKNNLYKLDESGNIIWQKDLQDKILSPLQVIDLYRDGRNEIIFNTSQKLYLINVNGDAIGNYPIRLPAPASNGCSVFSIPQRNKYTVFIACTNHFVYAYDGSGKPAPDWKYIHTENTVSKAIQPLQLDNTNYLTISETSGSVSIYDLKGNEITSFKDKFTQGANSTPELISADSSGNATWTTTDTSGAVIQFSSDGKIASKKFYEYSAQHSFVLNQTDNTIIFADTSRVTCYDLNGEEKWTLSMNDLIPSSIQLLHYADGSRAVIISSAKDLFYLINQNGKPEKGFPLNGGIFPSFIKGQRQMLISGNFDGMLHIFATE